MHSQQNEPPATRSILAWIGGALLFTVVSVITTIVLLLVGFILVATFQSHFPGPMSSALGLLGYAVLPLSVAGGILVASRRLRTRLLTWRGIVVGGLLIVAATLAVRHFVRARDWSMIQGSTDLQQADEVADLAMYEDPSFIHPCWVFAHFKIPPARVAAFVAANQCQPTDETSLHHQRDAIPEELQSFPASGARFYKKGKSRARLPFELLVDEHGTVALFLATPD